MTRDETIALFQRCEQARADALAAGKSGEEAHEAAKAIWNGWAEGMLAERKALEEAGEWAAAQDVHGQVKERIQNWIARASVDFSRCRVVKAGSEASSLRGADAPKQSSDPHSADLDRHGADAPRDDNESDGLITIEVADRFDCSGFIFPADASFDRAQFRARADFDSAQFHANTDFNSAQFHANTDFTSAQFENAADFNSAQFHCRAVFTSAEFRAISPLAHVWFTRTHFLGYTNFYGAQFRANANFDSAQFHAAADFPSAQFHAAADFPSVQFHATANFDSVQFHANATFGRVQFRAVASFDSAWFHAVADFASAQFSRDANFTRTVFSGPASFVEIYSRKMLRFTFATLNSGANFRGSILSGNVDFENAEVQQDLDFSSVIFHYPPLLSNSLAEKASFEFAEFRAPSLVLGLFRKIDHSMAIRFRRYKANAISQHDTFLEHQYFVGELVGRLLSRYGRFSIFTLCGIFYELLSNFGRSIIRPIIAWALVLAVFATYYMGETPDIARERDLMSARGASTIGSYVRIAPTLFQETRCSTASPNDRLRRAQLRIGRQTSATNEAWSLALKNGFVFIDWDRAEAARRTYGCLFGLTSDGSNTYPVVPRAVSVAGLIQNVASAVLIFLLLLGVRNLLKLK